MIIDTAREVVAEKVGRFALDRGSGGPAQPSPGRRRARAQGPGWRWLVVLLPTLLAGLYYVAVASDRYVSEAKIVVRSASDQAAVGGLSSFLKTAGIGGPDDLSVVQAYIRSRDAVRALQEKLPVREIFGPPDADFVARWPSIFYGGTEEDLYRYYLTMVTVTPNHTTGVLTVSVQAFQPEQAKAVASALVDLAEGMVNRLNERVRTESIKSADEEVERSERDLVASQVALTQFRNRELILDPERSAVLLSELIGKLNAELASTLAQIAQLRENAPNNPQLGPLNAHVESIRQQIEAQKKIVSSAGSGLADKMSEYERLNLQQQFATRRLAAAVAYTTVAKAQARRQQIFLEKIAEASLADKSTQPRRIANTMTILGFSLLFYLIVWVVGAGVREHAASHSG
jgi:capsular polysaccharide transport system permease protein